MNKARLLIPLYLKIIIKVHSALNDPYYKTKQIFEEKRKIKSKAFSQRETQRISEIRNIIKSKQIMGNSIKLKSNFSPVKESKN